MPQRSIIQYYNFNGSQQIASIWDIFSGTQIPRGTTSSVITFRVYNNYSGAVDITDAEDFKLVISGNDQFITYNPELSSYTDYTKQMVNNGYIDIRCIYSSGGALAESFTPFSGAYSGSGFNLISANGDNYNTYEMRFNIPASGTFTSSGSFSPSMFAEWFDIASGDER